MSDCFSVQSSVAPTRGQKLVQVVSRCDGSAVMFLSVS